MNLFSQITNALIEIPDGWTTEGKAHIMASAINALRPAVSVEIGVWAGRGLISLALAHKHVGSGIIYGIDPYSPVASADGQVSSADKEWWSRVDHDKFYQMAQDNIAKFGVQEFCKLVRQKSDDFTPPDEIGLLSLDGNHGVQAIRDIERYAPKIVSGGFMVIDDINWAGGAVSEAIKKSQEFGFRELYRVVNNKENWAILQRH